MAIHREVIDTISAMEESAFTVAELMTVLAVIAIAGALSAGVFLGWLPEYRLKSAALDLFSELQKARALAVGQNCEYAVRFDPVTDSYHLISGGRNGRYDGNTYPNDDIVEKSVHLADYGSGIRFGHGGAVINATYSGGSSFPGDGVSYGDNSAEFSPKGMANRLGYVYLQNSGLSAYAVATPTMAGFVRLVRWGGGDWR